MGLHTLLEPLVPQNGMKLKLTPEILLDKRCWLRTSSLWSHVTCLFYRRNHLCWYQQKLKTYIISQILLCVRLTSANFKLISPLDLKIWHGSSFHYKLGLQILTILKNRPFVHSQRSYARLFKFQNVCNIISISMTKFH